MRLQGTTPNIIVLQADKKTITLAEDPVSVSDEDLDFLRAQNQFQKKLDSGIIILVADEVESSEEAVSQEEVVEEPKEEEVSEEKSEESPRRRGRNKK